jgi:multiple sugar transport system permease protein
MVALSRTSPSPLSRSRLLIQRLATRGVTFAVLGVFVVFFGAPLVWLLLAPTKGSELELGAHPFGFGSFSDIGRAWHNLSVYSTDQHWQVLHWGLNSLIYGAAIVTLSCVLCVPAGYALAVYRFPGRKVILIATLIAMTIPVTALVLPQFIELRRLTMLNTRYAVILPSAFYPFGTFLAYIYYSTSLPRGLLEAARIDGCPEYEIFLRIALPLSRAVVPVIAFFSFVASYNNYILPTVVLANVHLLPLPVGLPQMASETGAIVPVPSSSELYPIHPPEMAIALLLAIVPVMVLFLFSQRYVREGFAAGGEKR